MDVSQWVNTAAAIVGMFGVLSPYIASYGKSRSFIGRTNRIKELIKAKKDLSVILSQKSDEEGYPSNEYVRSMIKDIDGELAKLEGKKKIGLFIGFSTIEVGIFFLLSFTQLSAAMSRRIVGAAGKGGYGFWEGIFEPISIRIILILMLIIISMSATLKSYSVLKKNISFSYYIENSILILAFNILSLGVFYLAFWLLVWLDRLTTWA